MTDRVSHVKKGKTFANYLCAECIGAKSRKNDHRASKSRNQRSTGATPPELRRRERDAKITHPSKRVPLFPFGSRARQPLFTIFSRMIDAPPLPAPFSDWRPGSRESHCFRLFIPFPLLSSTYCTVTATWKRYAIESD